MNYKIKSLYYNIKHGLSNIIKYLPAIWHQREWSSDTTFILLHRKFELMEESFIKNSNYVKAKRDIKQIKIANNLCKRLGDDGYLDNATRRYEERFGEWGFDFEEIPIMDKDGNSLYQLIDNRDELSKKAYMRASSHSKYLRKQDIDTLFNLLKKDIEKWWH